jgi:hypothetical protein
VPTGEYLTVNSIDLFVDGAWRAASLAALLDAPAVRGADQGLWRATGRRGRRRYVDESVRTIPLHVFGMNDHAGVAHSDPRMGLVANAEYLQANLGIGSSSGDGSVTCVWHRRDSSTKTFSAYVVGLVGFRKQAPIWATTTLDLVVPAGAIS